MSDSNLFPLKFNPILKDKIWGGEKLKTILNKPIGDSKECGESWELSGVPGDISIVSEGIFKGKSLVDLIDKFKGVLVGENVYNLFNNQFPLLIKFIDANQDLSIQVHPHDAMAKERHDSFGKTEMWYVVDAEKDATLISGFNKPTNQENYLTYFNSGKLTELLNSEKVTNDDVYFLPAGRVHTIGKGLLIAEIQQTSDITYRIYDFDRIDDNGVKRELHVAQALDAIDYTFYEDYKTNYNKASKNAELVRCPYFTTNRLLIDGLLEKDYSSLDSFVILMCLQGKGVIAFGDESISYTLGDTILIPNQLKYILIQPFSLSNILEIFIE